MVIKLVAKTHTASLLLHENGYIYRRQSYVYNKEKLNSTPEQIISLMMCIAGHSDRSGRRVLSIDKSEFHYVFVNSLRPKAMTKGRMNP